MSNLLNKNGKKKLLDRGPNVPQPKEFLSHDDLFNKGLETKEKPARKPIAKKEMTTERKVTSVRVKKSTQYKLNALVSINKAETIDDLVNNMIEEYLDTHITKDEKKQYDIVMELYRMRK